MPHSTIIAVIELTWQKEKLQDLFSLLRRGVLLKARVGSTIGDILCNQVGVAREYLDHRIGTVFLDGSPVDDVDSAVVKPGASLALSAAMPGLVGATMRKGGVLASMRQTITHKADEVETNSQEGFFVIRLYNAVAPELGPMLLESGVWLGADAFADFFGNASDEFWTGCTACSIDGHVTPWTKVRQVPATALVLLRVTT
jgi:hypothetical protein